MKKILAQPNGVKNDNIQPTGTRNAMPQNIVIGLQLAFNSGRYKKFQISIDTTAAVSIKRILPNSQMRNIFFLSMLLYIAVCLSYTIWEKAHGPSSVFPARCLPQRTSNCATLLLYLEVLYPLKNKNGNGRC